MKSNRIRFLAFILLGCFFLLSLSSQTVFAAERIVKLKVPGCT